MAVIKNNKVFFFFDFINLQIFLYYLYLFIAEKNKLLKKSKLTEKLHQYEDPWKRNKRAMQNGQPFQLSVELLIVTDPSIYLDHQRFANTTNQNLVFIEMKAYYAHLVNGVSAG